MGWSSSSSSSLLLVAFITAPFVYAYAPSSVLPRSVPLGSLGDTIMTRSRMSGIHGTWQAPHSNRRPLWLSATANDDTAGTITTNPRDDDNTTTVTPPPPLPFESGSAVDESKNSLRSALNLPSLATCLPEFVVRPYPLVVGHRGCVYHELENTREGFRKCAAMGADSVELDVFLLKCGTLVVFHGGGTDEQPGLLDEYCVGDSLAHASILDYTYQEASSQLSFNPNYEEFPCDPQIILAGRVPTLQEVLLDAKRTGLTVKIELKGPNTAIPVLHLVESLDMVPQCHYSSFDLEQIRVIRNLRPQRNGGKGEHVYLTGALFNDIGDDRTEYIQRALAVGASEIHLRYDECTYDRVQAIHAAKLHSMAWFRGPIGMKADTTHKFLDVGNETPHMYECVMETGVQQMCVNRPDVLLNLLNQVKKDNAIVSDEEEEIEGGTFV